MRKEYRPILDLPLSNIERKLDLVSLLVSSIVVLVGCSWLYLLPDVIPIHWNIKGEVDGFGSKYWILLLPLLSMIFQLGNRKITGVPHTFNYPVEITEQNVEQEYRKGRIVIRVVNLVSQVVFALIVVWMIKGAFSNEKDIGYILPSVSVLLVLMPVIYLVLESRKSKSIT